VFYYPVLACPLSQRANTPRSGSGNGPERALKAITKAPRAQRESPILPRASSASAGPIPRSAKTRQAERDRSAASLGSDHQNPSRTARKPLLPRASSASAGPIPRSAKIRPSGAGSVRSEPWRRTTKSPARSAKAPPSPSLLSERRTGPAERQIRQAERDRSAASLGGEHQHPSRKARKPKTSQSLLSERRTDPAEPTQAPHEQPPNNCALESSGFERKLRASDLWHT
jgi:hypothetical protein